MTDIDFDELDKAVNSLMSTTDTAPGEAGSTPTTTPVSAETPAEPAPANNEPIDQPVPVATPAASGAVPPAKKRSGRFMDVVHPSSDMAKRVSAPISREAATITPVSSSVEVPESAQEITAPEEPAVSEVVSPAPEESTMPDPITMAAPEAAEPAPATETPAELTEATEEMPAEDTPKEPTLEQPESAVPTDLASTEASADSPFLPDAKVEKRPLGGDTTPADGEDAANSTEEKDVDEPPLQPTPAELTPEVVAVEANEPNAFSQPEPKEEAEPVKPEASQPALAASGTIPQQYKEEPNSGDASHAAIYDVASHPDASPLPAKKKSGWLWVLWIFILLALGAGGAVALYLMNII